MVGKGRPKTFDNYDALEKAQTIFWEKGYEAASLTELVEGMGISRQSLYNTFGNKHDLFLKALEYYIHEGHKNMKKMLEGPLPAKEKLDSLIEMMTGAFASGETKGCFASVAIQELAGKDKDVQRIINCKYAKNYELFQAFFKRGLDSGEFKSSLSATELADLFDSILIGATSLCKISGRCNQIKNTFQVFKKQIEFK